MGAFSRFKRRIPPGQRFLQTAGAFVVAAAARRFIAIGVPFVAVMSRRIQKIRLVKRYLEAAMLAGFQLGVLEAQAHSPGVSVGGNQGGHIFA